MALGSLVKTLQNIMRKDAGINGDAQRIEQMTWLFFLKIYDAKEQEWEFHDDSISPSSPSACAGIAGRTMRKTARRLLAMSFSTL